MDKLSLTERDQQVIWHPYTQHKNMVSPVAICRGDGALLYDEQEKSYIDAISSWWVTIHGHAHPYIAARIHEQAKKLEHVIFTGFTHEPAVSLAERLLQILPGNFTKVFYSDNGSTAVEAALKMAVQYWKNKADGGDPTATRRKKILSFRNAYHGDTFGAMSISELSIFTLPFRDYLFEVVKIDTPTRENLAQLQAVIRQHGDDIACFIYEPLLQGAAGMIMYEAGLLDAILATAREHKILCIADEVLTGFGRTGTLFAGDLLKHKADIICLSKGLTGGTMALGVTVATADLFDAFISDDRSRTFFHGHSFTANPIACAASLASMDLLEKNECLENRNRVHEAHRQFMLRVQENSAWNTTKNIRLLGTVLAFEMNTGKDGYTNEVGIMITRKALEKGIYLRPLGNTVYLMPPYCITDEQLERIYNFLWEMVRP